MAKVTTQAIAAGTPIPAESAEGSPTPTAAPVAPVAQSTAAAALSSGAASPPLPDSAKTPADPVRPGADAPAVPVKQSPFILLDKWQSGEGASAIHGSLRAMEVPGGCLVKSAFGLPGYMGESICFVPDVRVHNGKLLDARENQRDGA